MIPCRHPKDRSVKGLAQTGPHCSYQILETDNIGYRQINPGTGEAWQVLDIGVGPNENAITTIRTQVFLNLLVKTVQLGRVGRPRFEPVPDRLRGLPLFSDFFRQDPVSTESHRTPLSSNQRASVHPALLPSPARHGRTAQKAPRRLAQHARESAGSTYQPGLPWGPTRTPWSCAPSLVVGIRSCVSRSRRLTSIEIRS